ncbi:hypothetical protein ACFLZO_00905, partial [Patescibacteria group bacterium]
NSQHGIAAPGVQDRGGIDYSLPYHTIPFFAAFGSFFLLRSFGIIPEMVIPIIAGVASLCASCFACVGRTDEDALFTIACGLANVGVAFFVFPWFVEDTGMAAFGAWHVASDLMIVAFFGADYMIMLKKLGRNGKSAASGISLQAAIMAAIFLYPVFWLSSVLLAVYAMYTFAVSGMAGAAAEKCRRTRFGVRIDIFLRNKTQ